MSESCSASKSHDSFNQNVIKKPIRNLFEDDHLQNNLDYIRLYDHLKNWLSMTNISNMNEKDLQLDFYHNCMKQYDQNIDNRLKYDDGFKGIIYKGLFERLMPDFCLVDYYNSHVKSSSSGLDLEFLPIHIVSILELKTKLKDSHIAQLLHYLRIVLDYSPSSRLFILGAITDFRDIRFATVSRSNDDNDDDNQIKYTVSTKAFKNENEYLLHYLTMFFIVDLSKFGFSRLESLPNHIRINNKLLGIGANSMVFNCYLMNDQSNEYALKISNKPVIKEVLIYKQLYDNKYKIIEVHPYVILFLHPPGQIITKENLFNNINIIWNQIKKAHLFRILHRDIRKSNIIQIFNHITNSFEILLIDWQSSIEMNSNVKYDGTLSTASNFILEQLTKNKNSFIKCLPIDDCISMMKMILLEIIPKALREAVLSEVQQGSISGIIAIYDEIRTYFEDKQPILLQIIDLLEKHRQIFDNEKLNYFIDKCIENHRWLYELENQQDDLNHFNDFAREIFFS